MASDVASVPPVAVRPAAQRRPTTKSSASGHARRRAACPSISSRCTLRGSGPSACGASSVPSGAELPGVRVVGEAALERVEQVVAQRRVLDRARRARRACRGCAASGRPSRCRPSPRRRARTRRCASARGSARRSRRRGCSPRRPATPGRRQQMPRMLRSTGTPACDARRARGCSAGRRASSSSSRIRAGGRSRAPRSCARSRRGSPSRRCVGRDQHLAVAARAREAGEEVEHVGDVGADLARRT